jgi:hypothetical protein
MPTPPEQKNLTQKQDILPLCPVEPHAFISDILQVIDDPKAVALVLAAHENKGLPYGSEAVLEILREIAEISADNFESAQDDSQRSEVIVNASVPGIQRASRVVSAALQENMQASDLLTKMHLIDLFQMVGISLKMDMPEPTKEMLVEIAGYISEYTDGKEGEYITARQKQIIRYLLRSVIGEEQFSIEEILDQQLDEKQDAAAFADAAAIHLSWSAIQLGRTRKQQQQRYQEMMVARAAGMPIEELEKNFSDLRMFKAQFKSFAEMVWRMFYEGYLYKGENNLNRAIARAIFEILKDLVQVDLPEDVLPREEETANR